MSFIRDVRNRYLLLTDAALIAASPWVAHAIRFEGFSWSPSYIETAIVFTVIMLPVKLAIFYTHGLYRRLWRHSSTPELRTIAQASAIAGALSAAFGLLVMANVGLTSVRLPISVAILDALFTLGAVASPRLLIKMLGANPRSRESGEFKRALIVGAGSAGELVLKELRANPHLGLKPVGFVDDDRSKHNYRLGDLPVFGSLSVIPEVAAREKVQEIIIAMPQAPGHVVRNVLHAAVAAKVPTRTVPGLSDIMSGRVRVSALRRVEIQDLLRREPVTTDIESVRKIAHGRSVLVTGAGGSIGSELARQIAQLEPAQLALLGNYENDIFDIHNELTERHPNLQLTPIIADVRDERRMRRVFETCGPFTVFHAAAHKHVPLMETSAAEAVTNNISGTQHVVDLAVEYHTEHFVFVSTDKAVRPANVMGATKRAAEMVVQDAASRHGRKFVSVRFGNVLGSRGSVVPRFLHQIQEGGPVTITHPEMRRFFMTIPEAVQLVLQAGAMGRGGEVFVLDMGDPVRIVDLAADLIRLSGLEVGKDIKIRYTGIRPGERLHEEVFFEGENILPTEHPKIRRALNTDLPRSFERRLHPLVHAARLAASDHEVRNRLRAIVPEFTPQYAVNGGQLQLTTSDSANRWAPTNRKSPHRGVERRRGDRRVYERRSGLDSRSQVELLMVGERRSKNQPPRRSGIDRRADVVTSITSGHPHSAGPSSRDHP